MKRLILLGAVLSMASVGADNLFPGGDFRLASDTLAPLAFADGGRVRRYTEDASWNVCGRVELDQVRTNDNGSVEAIACAIIGSDGRSSGVPVVGGTLYDFSIEVRGEHKQAWLGASAWDKGFWTDKVPLKTTVKEIPLKDKEWTVFRGSFTVPEGKTRAAIHLQIYSCAGKGQSIPFGVGSGVYFDNVTVEASTDGFAALKGGVKPVAPEKALAPDVTFSDFFRFDSSLGSVGPSPSDVTACVRCKDEALMLAVKVVRKRGESEAPDPRDCLEFLAGPSPFDPGRRYSQFGWTVEGKFFAQTGQSQKLTGFEIVKNETVGNVWQSLVRIPYSALGFDREPEPGVLLPVNVGYTANGIGYASWAPVASGFNDVTRFGTFCFGGYSAALKAAWCVDEAVTGRTAYERRVAELKTAAKKAEQDRFKEAGFTVSVVPVESEYATPFVPRESFHPVTNIHVRAAVNERTGVPVVILNTTDAVETYIVRLETSTYDPSPDRLYADKQFNGTWGLSGFPASQVVARVALPMKDTEVTPTTTRLDPLSKMDETCSMRIAPHEAGLVWFDFDTSGVKSGTYAGRVRVIPLSQPSSFKEFRGYGMGIYQGKMQDVPLSLEVLPFELAGLPEIPSGFFQPPETEDQFELMYGIGTREFSDGPSAFWWGAGKDGKRQKGVPSADAAHSEGRVRKICAWAAERGFKPTFFIGFSCYRQFRDYGATDPKKALEEWPDYVRNVKRLMNAWGVEDSCFNIEVYDEPDPNDFAEVKRVLELAKEAAPTVRLSLTVSAKQFPVTQMRELAGLVDSWILWSPGNFMGEDRLAFVRETRTAGKEVWHYTCSTSGRNPIYDWYRLHPWFGLRHDLSGNQFFWFLDHWRGYGNTDFKNRINSSIAYLSFDHVVPTLRYMAMRRGVTDLKYFDVLRRVAGDRDEVKEFMAEAAVRVVESERHDRTVADRMREKAVDLILKYRQ